MEPDRCIMLIRHAEKPTGDEPGIDAQGRANAASLSVRGWQRAGALVRLFAPLTAPAPDAPTAAHLLRPQHLVAARATEAHSSNRPRQTLLPLAEATGLTIDEQWTVDDSIVNVARALRSLAGPVLVSWRHEWLPALAAELLQRSDVPARWPDERFDLVWVVAHRQVSWSFTQVPQQLLAGDAAQAIRRRVRTAV